MDIKEGHRDRLTAVHTQPRARIGQAHQVSCSEEGDFLPSVPIKHAKQGGGGVVGAAAMQVQHCQVGVLLQWQQGCTERAEGLCCRGGSQPAMPPHHTVPYHIRAPPLHGTCCIIVQSVLRLLVLLRRANQQSVRLVAASIC